MGAAYDAMCENDRLESTLNKRNKKIREQKKLLIELSENIIRYFEGDIMTDDLEKMAKNILKKFEKIKKK